MIETGQSDFIVEIENALSAEHCKALIARFESSPNTKPGEVFYGTDTGLKKTTDLTIVIEGALVESLLPALKAYHKMFPLIPRNVHTKMGLIQRYMPGDFYHWHIDNEKQRFRQYVAIWYLNDVAEGGCTEFLHYPRKIVPVTGKLALFPAGWTHAHRGAKPISGPKYIATTWLEN